MTESELSPEMLNLLGKILQYEDMHGAHAEGWACFIGDLGWIPEKDQVAARTWMRAKSYYVQNPKELCR